MIRFVASLCAFALAGAAAAEPTTIAIRQDALPLSTVATAPGVTLTGAWRLSANHALFGGFSGLTFVEGELLLLSDAGAIVRWVPGAAEATLVPLPDACRAGTGKHNADAEAMALTPDGLEIRVALERGNRLCGFSWGERGGARSFDLDALIPSAGNRGVEAMASQPHRGTLLIAEAAQAGGHTMLWFDAVSGDVPSATMRYRPPAGFKPGDATFLPDGGLLVVNRRFSMPDKRATIVTIAPAFAPAAGGEISGAEVVRIERGPLAANYEGAAIAPGLEGPVLWLISDDNFSNRSGTMLLRFQFEIPARMAFTGTNAALER